MQLSHEDSLRINVLLSQSLQAVRIDESSMVLYALTEKGEAKVSLHPTGNDDKYLRQVRELLSTHALGSPGGYPVFLKRWTRMGQTGGQNLQGLLLLGEPEAVTAVANATDISEDIARSVWWAMPDSQIARKLLANRSVYECELGKELSEFLLEFIPFEQQAHAAIESVRSILQAECGDEQTYADLWKRAARKSAFYVGFLHAWPDKLPHSSSANPRLSQTKVKLDELIKADNIYAQQLCRLLSSEGQAFLQITLKAIEKLIDQDSSVSLLQAVANYSTPLHNGKRSACRDFSAMTEIVDEQLSNKNNEQLFELLQLLPLKEHIRAMLILSQVGEVALDPIFAQTDAVGSVMRRKMEPVTKPLQDHISILLS